MTVGLSSFREAYVLESWLILFKGINLVALLYLRTLAIDAASLADAADLMAARFTAFPRGLWSAQRPLFVVSFARCGVHFGGRCHCRCWPTGAADA